MRHLCHAFRLLAIAASLTVTAAAVAQSYDFTIAPRQGGIEGTVGLASPLAGTLIGNHDPVTNPTGTMTRPGFCCSSGNHAIPYTANLTGGGPFATQPAGAFNMDVDLPKLSATITNLFIDALNGLSPEFDATLSVTYNTFHTVNPGFIYPGGTVALPAGTAIITALTMTQTEDPATGALTPLGGDQYALEATVDVHVMYAADVDGDVYASDEPMLLALLLTGTLTIDSGGGGGAQLDLAINVSINETDKGPFEPFTGLPLALPTLNPDNPANVLLSGQVQSVTTTLDLQGELIAHGETPIPPCPPIPADLNCDGVVDGLDLLSLLANWGGCAGCPPQSCAADLNDDCVVDGLDLLMLLAAWG